MFVGLWNALNFSRKLFLNIIFIVIFLAILSVFLKDNNKITVPTNSALVLKLTGNLVIEKEAVDPFTEFMEEAFEQEDDNPEILLQDVLKTLNKTVELKP